MVGTLLMVAKVFDGITDVFMGRIIDVTKVKMGRARFWYLISIVPIGVCTFFIFNVPGNMGNGAKSAWVFIFYLLISAVFYTMNQVAYNMMIARTTKNQNDQVTMSGSAMIFGMVGSLLVASVTNGLVEGFGGGQEGWRMAALVYSVIGIVIYLIPFFSLKELPDEEFVDVKKEIVKQDLTFVQTIGELFKNKYFILILLLYLVGYMNTGVMQSSMVYYATYVVGNPAIMGALGLCSMVPLIVGMPFMPKMISKFGMRKACIIGNTVTILGCAAALLGQFVAFPIVIVGLVIKGIGSLPGSATYTPFIAKADEYHYKKLGHRVTGSLFSCSTVGVKLGQGIGTAFCGWMISWCGFDGTAQVQSALTNYTLIALYLFVPLVLTVVTGIIYNQMKVEDDVQKMTE